MTPKELSERIVVYILKNSPQTFDQIHERAKTKDYYTRDLFDKAMVKVGKYPNISVGANLVYKAFTPRQRKLPEILGPLKNYPELIEGVNDASHPIFDECCYCADFTPVDQEIKHHCIMGGETHHGSPRK